MDLKDFQIQCDNGRQVMRVKHELNILCEPVAAPPMHMDYGGYVRYLTAYEWSTGDQLYEKTTVSYEEFMHVIGESQ